VGHSKSPHRGVSDDGDVKRFRDLCTKIEKDRRTISLLLTENAVIKAEIQRCRNIIGNYPKMKHKYDRLSSSLSVVVESRSLLPRRTVSLD
jgi:hypothetical protein